MVQVSGSRGRQVTTYSCLCKGIACKYSNLFPWASGWSESSAAARAAQSESVWGYQCVTQTDCCAGQSGPAAETQHCSCCSIFKLELWMSWSTWCHGHHRRHGAGVVQVQVATDSTQARTETVTPLALVLLRPVLVLPRAWLPVGSSRRAGRCGATRTQILLTRVLLRLAQRQTRKYRCWPCGGHVSAAGQAPEMQRARSMCHWAAASVFLSCACIFLKVNLVTDLQISQCSLTSIKSCSWCFLWSTISMWSYWTKSSL